MYLACVRNGPFGVRVYLRRAVDTQAYKAAARQAGSALRLGARVHGQSDLEPALAAIVQAKLRAHGVGQLLGNGQAQPCATVFARCRGIGLFEGVKQIDRCAHINAFTAQWAEVRV